MDILEKLVQDYKIPKMARVRQKLPRSSVEDIPATVKKEMEKDGILNRIRKGDRVAITAGSRGLANIALILREIVSHLKEIGAQPFIIPAMGSHGGSTAEGQIQVLYNLGITEQTVGAPIQATMEVVQLGTTENGLPVYFDQYAMQADATIIVGRIKPHTSFRGRYESGIAKMIVIGTGKQKGAEICHSVGLEYMSDRIADIAKATLEKSNIVFGIGLIENAYDETCKIIALPKEEIMSQEPLLLEEARKSMPQILFDKYDVLVVDEIGKNISGTGMDPNVAGRFTATAVDCESKVQRVAVLDLTEETHGHAGGMGLADTCSRRMFDKIDLPTTYTNPLTSKGVAFAKIPLVMNNDRQAIQAAIKTCFDVDYNKIRMIRIKNTLKIDEIYISEHMMDEAKKNPNIEILEEPKPMIFDEKGNLFL
ncbi:MAG: lactate racemase domain-containing protein [Clostridia bacterium]